MQVGLPVVLQGLSGSYVTPPVPEPLTIASWINFRNRGDKLGFDAHDSFKATDERRLPRPSWRCTLDDSETLSRLVREALPYINSFFVIVAPNVFWNDGQGNNSHPQAGIGLDRLRLTQLRDEITGQELRSVVRFILAH